MLSMKNCLLRDSAPFTGRLLLYKENENGDNQPAFFKEWIQWGTNALRLFKSQN